MSLHCNLVLVQYAEFECGLFHAKRRTSTAVSVECLKTKPLPITYPLNYQSQTVVKEKKPKLLSDYF